MFRTNVKSIPETGINRGYRPGVSIRYLLLEEFGAPNFEMRYFELEPGASTSEDHHASEHEVFVVRGAARLHLADAVVELRQEDAVLIEPWEPHRFENSGSEPFGFLCIVPNGVSRSKKEVDLNYGERIASQSSAAPLSGDPGRQ